MLEKEIPYRETLEELCSSRIEVKQNEGVYRPRDGLLVAYHSDQNKEIDNWRTIVPDDVASRNLICRELHSVPYSLHPGVNRTL